MVDYDKCIDSIKKGQLLTEASIREICDRAKELLNDEQNIIRISTPVTICGDIHGQLEDLLELFRIGGPPPFTNYIFMGDYVDRGRNSIEVFLLLMLLKLKFPDCVYLIRGNHESRQLTQIYGFYNECLSKYGSGNVWKYCTDTFDFLSLGVLVDGKILCLHGGISPNVTTLDELNKIQRKQEIPHEGQMSDILWSDPDSDVKEFSTSPRGAGFTFGKIAVDRFNRVNNIDLIARSHQLVNEGFKYYFDEKLVTVWSAPNYMYRMANLAAILELDEHLNRYFKIFECCPESLRNDSSAKNSAPEYFL